MANNTAYTGNYTFSNNGVIIPDTADILETVQTEFKNALGQDLSLEESTPQGRLIDTETTARANTISLNAQMANVLINVSMSSGFVLDAWGANFDVPRNGAKPSRVTALVTGIPDTVIPAGSQAATESGVIWVSESEIIIGENGTAEGDFLSSQNGAIPLGVGELNTIVAGSTTGVNGWETIINKTAAALGNTLESDASYKLRILNSLFSGSALFGNYASACYKVANVNDVYAKDNPYGENLILDNITIPAHSVFVCVDGGNTEDVAYALYEVKSAGCGWSGNTTVTVIDKVFNTTNTVIFNIPEDFPLKIFVSATSSSNSNENLETEIKNTIVNYFNGMFAQNGYARPGIRALIEPFTIASILNSQITGVTFNKVEIGLLTPAAHAISLIIKASVTSGITWASVLTETFADKINTNGTYNFTFDGTSWRLNSETVNLAEYGITVTGDPITGDIVSIIFSDGSMSQSPIMLFATEKPTINADNITVTING